MQQQRSAPHNPPEGHYDPYMYWQHQQHPDQQRPHQPHSHQHHMQQTHTPPMQLSPHTQAAQPRRPSTQPVPQSTAAPSTALLHTLPSIITQTAQAVTPQSVQSPSLNVGAAAFVPGGGIGRRPVRIDTPNGDAVSFEGQIPASPKVVSSVGGVVPKRARVVIRMETEEQKNARLAREQEEKQRKEREAKEKEEAERKARQEEERRIREEARNAKEEVEAAAKAKEEAESHDTLSLLAPPKATNDLLPYAPKRPSPLSGATNAPERPSPLSISTTFHKPKRPIPGPLNLSSTQGSCRATPGSVLASARSIEDLNAVPYPETIKPPNPDLNVTAPPGKFRYDREFLLQFMNVCKEKPDSLPPLEAIGLDPGEQGASYPSGSRAGGRRVDSMGMGGAPMQRSESVGLGLGPGLAKGGFAMGNFQSPSSRLGDSQSRFEASSARAGIPFPGGAGSHLTPMTRSANQRGVGGGGPRETKRTRSQRGRGRGEMQNPNPQVGNFEPVAPPRQGENRWATGSALRTPQQVEHHQLVERKVKVLLIQLTMNNFDSISDQIIDWANRSEQETDGATLMQVTTLVYEKAKNNEERSELYARLCRKMMERVSPNVQDVTARNSEGQPIGGGMLFRKYLLARCKDDFERGCCSKEAAPAAAASRTGSVVEESFNKGMPDSDEHLASAEVKRQGLGLVRFVGELFKLQMLTERIMHEYIKKLLSNEVNPEEEEIESLCKLLTIIGPHVDKPKARNHMDRYFEQMQEMAKGDNVDSRMQLLLLDVIELRARHWQAQSTVPQLPPSKQAQDKPNEARHGTKRSGSRRGDRRDTAEPDGWINIAGGASTRPPARAGDLSQFGKITKPTGIQFGPSTVFRKKNPKREATLSRASRANMSSELGNGESIGDGPPAPERLINGHKPRVDLQAGPGGASDAEGGSVRRELKLLPKAKGNANV